VRDRIKPRSALSQKFLSTQQRLYVIGSKEPPYSIRFLRKCRYSQFSCGEGAGRACMNDLVVALEDE